MNRGEMLKKGVEENIEYDDGFSSIVDLSKEENYKKEDKVVIWDADSLIHHVMYSGKDELGNRNPEYIEADLEMLQGKLTEYVLKVLNKVEKYYNILALYIFIKGRGNFRKDLYPEYKAKRPEPNPLVNKLYDYIKIAHQAIESHGAESEDYVYTVSKKIDHNGIILYVDHDLLEIPSIFYNYQKDKWLKVDKDTARMNKYSKLIIGESGDNVNLSKGLGKKHFEKFYNKEMTDEQIENQLIISYTKVWKTEELAKEKLELAKKLLYLKEIE